MPHRRTSRVAVAPAAVPAGQDARRALLADWCRLVGQRLGVGPENRPAVGGFTTSVADAPASPEQGSVLDATVAALDLPPRVGQTLLRLLAGRSEKQIALDLSVSPHTVHTYVKQLHKRLGVSSRGELLALFVRDGGPRPNR